MDHLCGWHDDPAEVERLMQGLPIPCFDTPEPKVGQDQHNHLIFKQVTGDWHDEGPQLIGDCTSWGNGRLVDYTDVLETFIGAKGQVSYEYQKTCTEVIYANARTIGGQQHDYSDGAAGVWYARTLPVYGSISRKNLDALGVGGTYSGQRARQWGAQGIPSNLQSVAKSHVLADMTNVPDVDSAVWHIQNYRVVAVCSNVGFQNGPGGTTQRDSTGRATPAGRWNHCMCFVSVRWRDNAPQLLLTNQWPKGSTNGPKGDVDIPDCSWWVDAEVADAMLRQGDSFTGSTYKGYPARQLTWVF